jgi:glucosamine--fructose-6-phosphate aminotransferase (isomerizing)
MGSSHFAGLPTWQRLLALGQPAWAVDTGQLLDNPGLVDPGTLLVVTSQSGASGEVVELLARRAERGLAPATLVGITDGLDSPLARGSDLRLPLRSGDEATVSTKSYLNTLAVHRLVQAAFGGEDLSRVRAVELPAAADAVQRVIDGVDLTASAARTAEHAQRRLAYVGQAGSAGTGLFAALITKEAAKIPAEGYVGGQFRHGPFELAGNGLTAVLFAARPGGEAGSLRVLAGDLVETGTHVVVVGDPDAPADVRVDVQGTGELAFRAASSVVAELFAVDLARANGVVPGAFVHGSKITSTV